ncbi:unnamed protein product [Phytomonas sp. EM1]|nr:unnamed protein product [Phytomonas sp. EM1]|eukprot:CCW60832.1 unnamed protein product [Phytomonas sp. isolate EM1]
MQFKNAEKIPSPGCEKDKFNGGDRLNFSPNFGDSLDPDVVDSVSELFSHQQWYANANLCFRNNPETQFGFFSSFSRQCQDSSPSKISIVYDSCNWSLIDIASGRYYADSLLDCRCFDEMDALMDPGIRKSATCLQRALFKSIKKGRFPRPDRLSKSQAKYQTSPLRISLDEESVFEVTQSGCNRIYHFFHINPVRGVSVDLFFETVNNSFQHSKNDIANTFCYYFPMMRVSGSVTISGYTEDVIGEGWYNREFGGFSFEVNKPVHSAYGWLSLHLSDGSQFSLFHVMDYEATKTKECFGVYISNGKKHMCSDISLEIENRWVSLVTFIVYPSHFSVNVPSIGLSFKLFPTFSAQEFNTVMMPGGGFFEGCMVGKGIVMGNSISLKGFLECKNYIAYSELMDLLNIASKYVRGILSQLYPLKATDEWLQDNVLGRYSFQSRIPADKICEILFSPVRALINRGGKSWRSLLLASCCNALSCDYFDCSPFIAMIELLHVGSLIIDDIQDNSLVRRGGRCIHIDYGVPTAINAGTACYFMAPYIAGIDKLSEEKANKVYKLYLDLLRIGHLGQGLDIYGLDYLMPQAVASGDVHPLLEALEAIHTCKTGSLTSTLCSIACVLCSADPKVFDAMKIFGLNLGLAFQIIDDVRNIKSFRGGLNEKEDIRNGKITYPIVKAMSRLSGADRQLLWDVVKSKPSDPEMVMVAIKLIEKVGGVDLCLQDAQSLIERAWSILDPLLDESISKNILFIFSKSLLNCDC